MSAVYFTGTRPEREVAKNRQSQGGDGATRPPSEGGDHTPRKFPASCAGNELAYGPRYSGK
jgi:hypothetical protein